MASKCGRGRAVTRDRCASGVATVRSRSCPPESAVSLVLRCGKPRTRPRRLGSARGDVLCDVHRYLYAVLSCAVDRGVEPPRCSSRARSGLETAGPRCVHASEAATCSTASQFAGLLSPADRPPSSHAGSAHRPRGSPWRGHPPDRAAPRREARKASSARTGAAGRIPARPYPPPRPPPR